LASYKEKCEQVVKLETSNQLYQTGEFFNHLHAVIANGIDLRASNARCMELEKQYLDEAAEHKKKLSMCIMK
jgi:hypothetical protein